MLTLGRTTGSAPLCPKWLSLQASVWIIYVYFCWCLYDTVYIHTGKFVYAICLTIQTRRVQPKSNSWPHTLAQAISPLERWYSMSQEPVSATGDQSAKIHIAPKPYSTPGGVGSTWRADPCASVKLNLPAGPQWARPQLAGAPQWAPSCLQGRAPG